MPQPPRLYPLLDVVRVVDGDTLYALVDLGFCLSLKVDCRLARIDTPELPTPEGQHAKRWLAELIDKTPVGGFDVRCFGREKYGRWLVDLLIRQSGVNVNDLMLSQGIARAMKG